MCYTFFIIVMDMPEQQRASDDSQQETAHEADVSPQQPAPTASEISNAIAGQPATAQQLQKTEEKIEERMSGFERSMIRLTRAGVAIAIITGVIFAGQLYEIYKGGTQTDKLVDYANRQSRAASDISASVGTAAQAMNESATQAKAAVAQAKTAMDAGIAAARLDQRAWLTVKTISLQNSPTLNEPLRTQVEVVNSGKTPAIDAIFAGNVLTRPASAKDIFGPTTGTPPSRGEIGPNVPAFFFAESSEPVRLQGQIDALKTTHAIIVTGIIIYKDVFRTPHATRFCFQLPPEAFSRGFMHFAACQMGNLIEY